MITRIRMLPWVQYKSRIAQNPTVIIPTGAVEVYGPHLPMGTDLYVADALAEAVARKTGALIAPTVELGESMGLTSFDETFTLSPAVLQGYLDELFAKLVRDGFKNFLFLTGHAGNVPIISYLVTKYLHQYDIKCAQVDVWRFLQTHSGDVLDNRGYMAHGHASECGTSMMLYLHPEVVDKSAITKTDPGPAGAGFTDFITYRRLKNRTAIALSGDAESATAEKGEKLFEIAVARILTFMEENF